MNHEQLEIIYEALANKIDEVGPANTELFLAKLVLLLANHHGDIDQIQSSIEGAAASL